MQDIELNEAVEMVEAEVNARMAQIIEQFGVYGVMTALVNVGTAVVAKAIVLTQDNKRDELRATLEMLIDTRVQDGDAAIKSAVIITQAMGSTCRPH